ncbi:MAG: hypothetical protein N2314_05015 [Brevinematales bacterium]|nr:hypothetical protein [Brevinematales bacterium]
MDEHERVELIRQGNACMQEKRYKEALSCFVRAGYQDGLVRIGDVLYEQKNYVGALKVYVRSGHKGRITAAAEKVAAILHTWLEEDKKKPQEGEVTPWRPVVLSIQDLMALDSPKDQEEDKEHKGDKDDS